MPSCRNLFTFCNRGMLSFPLDSGSETGGKQGGPLGRENCRHMAHQAYRDASCSTLLP